MIRPLFTFLIFYGMLISARAQSWQGVSDANGTAPLARHENGFVEVNGKFYLIGGRSIKSVNIFDPSTRVWTAGAAPPIELHHFQRLVYQKIFIERCSWTPVYPRAWNIYARNAFAGIRSRTAVPDTRYVCINEDV
jgi:hypothetical protein